MTTHYEIENDVGKAPLGHVWTGRDRLSGIPVVVKKIPLSAIGGGRNGWARHVDEIKTLTRLSHPRIAPVLEIGEEENQLVMVTQRPRGRSMSSLIEERGRIRASELGQWVLPIIEALAVAHDAGVLHRQIHEDLIVVDENDLTVLTGFGLTVDRRVKQDPMPPELLTTGTGTQLSDQYSVGAMLDRLAAVSEPIPGLRGVIGRATEAEPKKRFPDVIEMMDALRRVFETASLPASHVSEGDREPPVNHRTPQPEKQQVVREEISAVAHDLHSPKQAKKNLLLPYSVAAAVILVVGLGWVFLGSNAGSDFVEIPRPAGAEKAAGPMASIGEMLSEGRLDEAAQRLELILSENQLSDPTPALDALGTIRLQEGLSDEASNLFERALTIQAKEALYYKLSLAQASAGKDEQVVRTLDEGLRLFPESERLKEARFHLGGV